MLKLDRSRAFGTITPAWQPEDCDRPAYYEQDGKLFDAHDRQIVPGKPLPVEVVADKDDGATAQVSPYDLLRQADVMPWAAFRKHAKAILGDTCPASKADILTALQGAVQHFEQRQQKRKTPKAVEGEQKSAGLTWNGLTGQPDAPENLTAKPAPAPVVETGGLDLAAWARGQKEYLFAEVRKGIRAKYGVVVTERDDAVNLLVDNNVITQAEARKDVRRVA